MQETRQQLLERIAQLEQQLEAQTQQSLAQGKDALGLSLLQRNQINREELEALFARLGLQPKDGTTYVLTIGACTGEAPSLVPQAGPVGEEQFDTALYRISQPAQEPSIGQQLVQELRTAADPLPFPLLPDQAETEQGAPNWLLPLMKQLRTGFRDPNLNVNYIADQIGITPVHMSRVFRKFQGFGIMDYIHQLRVEDAKRLIMSGCSVKNAMSMVGYTNQLTMTRAFKRLDGSTPGQYALAGKSAG